MAGNKKRLSVSCSSNCSSSTFIPDDCPVPMPAAGNRNGTELNNEGSNGNYWSSSLNEDYCNNAYNLNFNSNNHDWNNWNNRNNGHTVRPVSELAFSGQSAPVLFKVSSQQLLADLYRAYKDARRHKRRKKYQLAFEIDFEKELVELRDEIMERRYRPGVSSCFIIKDPKLREVFAAEFRDRVVHHLYYNYTYELFERTFINDSYSCRKKKGTHYGFKRLQHHIRSVSRNFTRSCYVMKIDIKGYFIHIDRALLLSKCLTALDRMAMRRSDVMGKAWCEKLDYDLLYYLSNVIIMNDPVDNCMRKGCESDWGLLPNCKSLFHSRVGCGLPIGNLTSQLFSNVYMNEFDQFVKRSFPVIAYGRYVDDSFFVSPYKSQLRDIIPQLEYFLNEYLILDINPHKLQIFNAKYGVEFLGGYCKPYRSYVANGTMSRMKRKIGNLMLICNADRICSSINSFLGVMSHHSTFQLRRNIFERFAFLSKYGFFASDYNKFEKKLCR